MNLGELSLSLLAIINRDGITRVLHLPLNEGEKKALQGSANTLKTHISSLDFSSRSSATESPR
jgi:malate/lactate dehydrogenase